MRHTRRMALRKNADLLWPPLIVALVFVAYWPGLGGGYIFDDFPNIVSNMALHVASLQWQEWVAATFSFQAGPLQRPLAMLSFAVNHYFTGLDPAPMKAWNIALHALNALLVLGLLRSLLAVSPEVSSVRQAWGARVGAAIWALHPVNLLAVLYIVQRMESLSHLFVFAGLWLYLHGRRQQLEGQNGWPHVIAGLAGGTILGLLAKESAALLPLYAFLLEVFVLKFHCSTRKADRRLQATYAIGLFLPAIVGGTWLLLGSLEPAAWASRDYGMGERLLTQARVLTDYLRWIILPDIGQLSLYHDDYEVSRSLLRPPSTLLAILLLASLVAVACWARLRIPLLGLGIAWFFAAHLLTGTFMPLELVYEHRNYFASLGVVIAGTGLVFRAMELPALRLPAIAMAAFVVIGMLALTHLRAREWSDPLRFASSEASKHPDSPRATYGLAHTLAAASRFDPDSPLFVPAQEALERARHTDGSGISPRTALLAMHSQAGTLPDPGLWDEVISLLRRGPIGPQQIGAIQALVSCAREERCTFPPERMDSMFSSALSHARHPDLLALHGDYLLNVRGQPTRALALWHEAVERAPSEGQYRINLAKLLIALGHDVEAREQIATLRRMGRFGQYAKEADALTERMEQRGAAVTESED
jgi:protein O-mannosyl-transferase